MMRALAWIVAALFAIPAAAQNFPAKPIRLICPFPPAGAVDITSRAIAHEMTRSLGVPVAVENRPGAGGNIGGAEAARSAADGYTLFMTTSPIQAINPALYSKMPFDPNKDFAFVSVLVSLNNVLVVNPAVNANSVQELIALAKSQPGKLNFASSGHGTSIHLSAELFKMMTGVDIVHIVYKGSAPAIADLISGQVNMMFDNIPSAAPHIRAGKLKPLAVTSAKRAPSLPDVPTTGELGYPKVISDNWYGLVAPAGTPPDVIKRIHAAAIAALQSPALLDQFAKVSGIAFPATPEEYAAFVADEQVKWSAIIKAIGFKE